MAAKARRATPKKKPLSVTRAAPVAAPAVFSLAKIAEFDRDELQVLRDLAHSYEYVAGVARIEHLAQAPIDVRETATMLRAAVIARVRAAPPASQEVIDDWEGARLAFVTAARQYVERMQASDTFPQNDSGIRFRDSEKAGEVLVHAVQWALDPSQGVGQSLARRDVAGAAQKVFDVVVHALNTNPDACGKILAALPPSHDNADSRAKAVRRIVRVLNDPPRAPGRTAEFCTRAVLDAFGYAAAGEFAAR